MTTEGRKDFAQRGRLGCPDRAMWLFAQFVGGCRAGFRSLAGEFDTEPQVDAARLLSEDLNFEARVFEAFNCLWKQ